MHKSFYSFFQKMALQFFLAILLNVAVFQVTGVQNYEILTKLGKVNGVIHPSPGGNVYRFANFLSENRPLVADGFVNLSLMDRGTKL